MELTKLEKEQLKGRNLRIIAKNILFLVTFPVFNNSLKIAKCLNIPHKIAQKVFEINRISEVLDGNT